MVLTSGDEETEPQSGINMLIGKLQASTSTACWNYVLKNLIVMDRVVEARLFLDEIAHLRIPYLDHYRLKDETLRY